MLPVQVHLTLPAWTQHVVDMQRLYPTPEEQVLLAIELSRMNVEENSGGPFGAALFTQDGRLISIGVNRVIQQNCSVAHAETMAYMTAQQRLQRFRLNESGEKITLATSSQPCCQCFGATVWAGIDRLLIGARSEDVESLTGFDEGPLPADWVGELQRRGIEVRRDICRDQARAALALYRQVGGHVY
ncbi:MAG: nucleoside deaminase [Xanthomonadales bacterium]|nr:nucleoside deaminase [Xanthomonadales bacterium]MCE7932912.1 nucleoside deaminase [Xanthomonadales bacterium PRO6]